LVPLGTRIRTRLVTEPASRDELLTLLRYALSTAGNATLMTALSESGLQTLRAALPHCSINPRSHGLAKD